MSGPLSSIRVIELAGLGPGPFAGMMLADMGAEVIRVDRPVPVPFQPGFDPHLDVNARGRRSVAIDLKSEAGRALVLRLVARADAFIEGFRPGVTERMGLGPEDCMEVNARLVYGRMTGWGQDGPLAQRAGHDINYVGLTGALHAIGRPPDRPVVPLNLVADYGGGGMLLAFGIVCALLEAGRSGKGQVVDAAMVDGVAALSAALHGLRAMGLWSDERGANLLDGGAPFYDVYACADGRFVAVGALEPQFYAELCRITGVPHDPRDQADRTRWPALRAAFLEAFGGRSRDEWCALADGVDACLTPVLSWDEAPDHPHNAARGTFMPRERGVAPPAPAPRFDRTAPDPPAPAPATGAHTDEVLVEAGLDPAELALLRDAGTIA